MYWLKHYHCLLVSVNKSFCVRRNIYNTIAYIQSVLIIYIIEIAASLIMCTSDCFFYLSDCFFRIKQCGHNLFISNSWYMFNLGVLSLFLAQFHTYLTVFSRHRLTEISTAKYYKKEMHIRHSRQVSDAWETGVQPIFENIF